MFDKFAYYGLTFLESGLSVFGIRAPYEQPSYQVVRQLEQGVELRDYPACAAVETASTDNGGDAFGRLFRYIAGANRSGRTIAMTTPVEEGPGQRIAMTVPVEQGGTDGTMRFFLPASVVRDGPPVPTDPRVRIVTIPARRLAVLRFTGSLDEASRQSHADSLLSVLRKAGIAMQAKPSLLAYDPPFTIPFLRRNEIAVEVPR